MSARGNFHVYKSSAGSGKTHTLTMVYLSIVLKRPTDFRHILAITFTNKAANEIKQRILDTLKFLSSADVAALSGFDKEKLNQLCERTGLEPMPLQENARQALGLILHHYHDFAVSTIDSFVHKIIRTFAFDLKLMSNFEVEMDTDMLLRLTVDKVLADAGRNAGLTSILVNYIEDQADNDENWQIDTLLTSFAKNLFNESAAGYIDRIGAYTPESIKALQNNISEYIRKFYEEIENLGNQAISLIDSHHISPDVFYRKDSGIYGYFNDPVKRIEKGGPNKYVIETVEQGKWTPANNKLIKDEEALMEIKDDLLSIYHRMQRLAEERFPQVVLYGILRNNLYPMAVLNALSERLSLVLKERNVVPIAAFNKIISEIVMHEPVPFIYERTGEKYRHFLVDEFQDTSVMQWQNLLPMLDNALSTGHLNMIVGDGKQAIYRWRNGDADQFVNLPQVSNPTGSLIVAQRSASLAREFFQDKLTKNWRSRKEIVDFNNRFFCFAASWFLNEKSIYYDEVMQEADPAKTGGLIRITLYTGTADNYEEAMCDQVLDCVNENVRAGYQPGDICILVRTNVAGQVIASHLTESGIKVVSSDSLLLNNAAEVQFLISWFRLLFNPQDIVSAAHILEYLYSCGTFGAAARHAMLQQSLDIALFYKLLDENGFHINVQELEAQALFDQTQTLIRIFRLNEIAPLYTQFFLDQILSFSLGSDQGISGFLEYWEQQKAGLSVVLPASADAVQVMTIHKAKGLEFPVVIAAFVDYTVRTGRDYTWVTLEDDPLLPEVKVAMLKLTQKVLNTPFAALYEEEKAKAYLDLLNMLYVTLTRPSERLFVFTGKLPEKDSASQTKTMTDLFAAFYVENNHDPRLNPVMEMGKGTCIRGYEWKPNEALLPEFISNAWHHRIVIASRAPDYWLVDAPEAIQAAGLMMHEALKAISVAEDVKPAVERLLGEGSISPEQAANIEKHLKALMNHQVAGMFFEPGIRGINEAEILTRGGKSCRPDRIVFRPGRTDVIDYKTGTEHQSHHHQVQQYASLLTAMGYPQVKAWLIYLGDEIKVTVA